MSGRRTEKLNGVTVNLFPYDGEWLISVYVGNNLAGNQLEWTVREMLRKKLGTECDHVDESEVKKRTHAEIKQTFWSVWKKMGYELPSFHANPRCYTFVLQFCRDITTAEVIDEHAEQIISVGMRDLSTMTEANNTELAALAEEHGWRHIAQPPFDLNFIITKPEFVDAIRKYDSLQSKEAKLAQQCQVFKLVHKEIEHLDFMECEGAVACDSHLRRVTFNSKQYDVLEKFDAFLPFNQKQRLFYELLKQLYDDQLRVRRFCASVPQWASWCVLPC